MSRPLRLVLASLTASSALVLAPSGFGAPALPGGSPTLHRGASEYVPGQVIVRYSAGTTMAERRGALRAPGATAVQSLALPRTELVELPAGVSVLDGVAELERNPDVDHAEPNYILHASAVPNDPRYADLWAMPKIGAPAAWDSTTGSASVVVAVIDTGIAYDHPDLEQNMWTNPGEIAGNGIDDDSNGKIDDLRGWDFIWNDNTPLDGDGHGTHVAGTIGARGNNGIGVAGVNWQVSLMALRAGDATGSFPTSAIVGAVAYACAKNARVVNGSFGGSEYSQTMLDAITAPACANTLFVFAAGNGGDDGAGDNNDTTPQYPCSYASDRIICVAASNQSDGRASFSNYGLTSVDLAAPGFSITSSIFIGDIVLVDGFGDSPTLFSTRWGAQSAPGGHPLWGQQFVSFPGAITGSPSVSESPAGNYSANTDSTIRTLTPLDLTGKAGCHVDYFMRLNTELGHDFFFLEGSASPSGPWTDLSQGGWTGDTEGEWFAFQEDVGALDGVSTAYLRLRLTSDGSVQRDGAVVEDIAMACAGQTPDGAYIAFSGTSMAAPHVTGAAALMLARNPALTRSQLRSILLGTVTPVSAFAKTGPTPVATGGRLNLAAAIVNALPPAAPAITGTPPAVSKSIDAAFAFTTPPSATISCRLDGAQFEPCTTGLTQTYFDVPDGEHAFEVRATNLAGSNTASFTWTVDTAKPNTKLTGTPRRSTKSRLATLRFISTEASSTFKCKLDKGRWTACKSPKSYKRLKKGKHTFQVVATDPAGNADGSPARRIWTVK